MIRIIAAMTLDRVIGVRKSSKDPGRLPWEPEEAKGDLVLFKKLTTKSHSNVVIMGRKTYQSMSSKPLDNRHNIVVSSKKGENITEGGKLLFIEDFQQALDYTNTVYTHRDGWTINIIGGNRIFSEAMGVADEIFLTVVPIKAYDKWDDEELVEFPSIPPTFYRDYSRQHPENPKLLLMRYARAK